MVGLLPDEGGLSESTFSFLTGGVFGTPEGPASALPCDIDITVVRSSSTAAESCEWIAMSLSQSAMRVSTRLRRAALEIGRPQVATCISKKGG